MKAGSMTSLFHFYQPSNNYKAYSYDSSNVQTGLPVKQCQSFIFAAT